MRISGLNYFNPKVAATPNPTPKHPKALPILAVD